MTRVREKYKTSWVSCWSWVVRKAMLGQPEWSNSRRFLRE